MKVEVDKQKTSVQKWIHFLIIFIFILLALLCISFTPLFKRNNPIPIQSALLNPKYHNDIAQIIIKSPKNGSTSDTMNETELVLTKSDSIWVGSYQGAEVGIEHEKWPASKETVENLITSSETILKMYKISDSVSHWNSFSVSEGQAFELLFVEANGTTISDLFFGLENPLTNRIAVRSGSKQTVYEVDNSFSTFLTTDDSFWCDPYLYPQAVTGLSTSEEQSFLRHGKITTKSSINQNAFIQKKKKDFGNGAEVVLSIFQSGDEFCVVPVFTASPACTNSEKECIFSLSYVYTISSWTYQKLLEEK